MKQLIKKLINYKSKTHHFLITSHGQTASMWLAAVLNQIPEIFCSHGYTYPPKAASLEELSLDEYKFRVSCFERFEKLTLNDFFSELKSVTDKKVVGNVLAFFLGRLFSKVNGKLDKNITVVNMVRHPVTRITSTLSTWTNKENGSIPSFVELDFNTRCAYLIDFLAKKHTIDFSKNTNKVFLVALLAIEDITADVNLANSHGILNLKYEDITTNKETFKNLIKHITKDKVKLSAQFLDNLIYTRKINAHNDTGISEANKQFITWETWKQDAFRFVMERSNMLNIYDNFNYDFSFMS